MNHFSLGVVELQISWSNLGFSYRIITCNSISNQTYQPYINKIIFEPKLFTFEMNLNQTGTHNSETNYFQIKLGHLTIN